MDGMNQWVSRDCVLVSRVVNQKGSRMWAVIAEVTGGLCAPAGRMLLRMASGLEEVEFRHSIIRWTPNCRFGLILSAATPAKLTLIAGGNEIKIVFPQSRIVRVFQWISFSVF